MKKMIGLLLAALMLLCGCAQREQVPQTEPVTLRVVTSFGSEDGNRRNFEAAVAAYEASTEFGVRWLRCVQRGMESPGPDGF